MDKTTDKCKHVWIVMEDGSLDKLCVLCGKKVKQMVSALPLTDFTAPTVSTAAQPALRETVTIHMGGNLGTVDVYKDRLAEEINKQLNLSIRAQGMYLNG